MADWYELFFDLVFVVVIAISAELLEKDTSFAVVLVFLLLGVRSNFSYEIYEREPVSHALERVGLFVVIVIGEAVYLAVTGLAAHPSVGRAAAELAGFLVCALVARAFFRSLRRRGSRSLPQCSACSNS